MLTSAFATAVAVASCGGGSHKKTHYVGEAGEGGVAGVPAGPGPTGGSGATTASGGEAGEQGGGTSPGGSAGAAGGEEAAGAAGASGAPPVIAMPIPVAHLLFTVGPGAKGLAGTALAAQANPQSVIFGSSSENPDPVNGSNSVLITGDQLGLAATDTIDAFGALQPKPVNPVYFFSVASGAVGGVPTRLARSAETNQAIGDVYFSDTSLSFRDHNEGETEGGDEFGYNGLVANEVSLGLSSVAPVDSDPDDLTGFQLLPDGLLPRRIYFSVSPDSVGLPGTAVAGESADGRACTIFQSDLDGKNSVAFTCASLGLLAPSDVKALTVFGSTTPTEILFSVTADSTGVADSAVDASTSVGGDVFVSTGDGQNSQRVARIGLGLAPNDQLDALTTVDRAPPSYSYASACTLTPSPMSADSIGLSFFSSAHLARQQPDPDFGRSSRWRVANDRDWRVQRENVCLRHGRNDRLERARRLVDPRAACRLVRRGPTEERGVLAADQRRWHGGRRAHGCRRPIAQYVRGARRVSVRLFLRRPDLRPRA